MRKEQFGPLNVRIVGGPDGSGGGNGPVVVLLHGFGAPGTDLVPLGQAMGLPEGVRFVFPEAPIELGREYYGGRAWWLIDMLKLQIAIETGQIRDLSNDVPQGMAEANEALDQMLDALEADLGVKGDQIVLGGFSQGAMLATDLLLRRSRPIGGLVILSGTLLAQHEWKPRMASRAGLPVYQSHGTDDPLLPFALADQLRESLQAAGLDVEWVPFTGEHEIPMRVLTGLRGFIARTLGLSV